MSILSKLFGKKETLVVGTKGRNWKDHKCPGSGTSAVLTDTVRTINGTRRRLGVCPKCGHQGLPTKNGLVAAHKAV